MIENQLNENTLIRRSETLLSNNLGDDVVMMDIEQGSYYGLEAVAARIWELTENPVTVGSLCASLMSEYEVSEEQCNREVSAFLNNLLERKIIEIAA